ncbi:hypothetical protein [Mangrovibacterium lignilyticum]|uniref:hypothetical protein n=1 Tax=Mangrovibacterium lignilyticum TaxID=2668052 RepID=UPI0013D5CF23|nr:hypothetical protein [Mangrovibacterium lignilyticum]
MNQQDWHQTTNQCPKEKPRRGSTLGVILIVVGIYWIIKETGWAVYLPGWEFFRDRFVETFSFLKMELGDLLLPVLLLVTGLLLVSGKRRVGGLLIVIALLIFIPGIVIPGVLMVLFFPLLLVIIGIMLIKSLL